MFFDSFTLYVYVLSRSAHPWGLPFLEYNAPISITVIINRAFLGVRVRPLFGKMAEWLRLGNGVRISDAGSIPALPTTYVKQNESCLPDGRTALYIKSITKVWKIILTTKCRGIKDYPLLRLSRAS